mgnify:CR=1 FL=1|jgi:hypothetical protein
MEIYRLIYFIFAKFKSIKEFFLLKLMKNELEAQRK